MFVFPPLLVSIYTITYILHAGFRDRLAAGETIVIAEGYLFEFERRGFVRAGCFVPEVVLEKPEQLKALHEEFVHSGSDVVEAYTVGNLQLFELQKLRVFES